MGRNFLLLMIPFFLSAKAVYGQWPNPDYAVYRGGPDLTLNNIPADQCVLGNCLACVMQIPGSYTFRDFWYDGSVTFTGSKTIVCNFTGARTVKENFTDRSFTYSVFKCNNTGNVDGTQNTFTVTGIDFKWNTTSITRCVNGSDINLDSHISDPGSVTYSAPCGSCISGSNFIPANAAIGDNTITATKIYGNGTTSVSNLVIHVDDVTVLTFGPIPDVCVDAPNIDLRNFASPNSGGVFSFSGNGVIGDEFDPSNAGTGTHTLTFSFTNGDNCTSTANTTVKVANTFTIGAGPNLSRCLNFANIDLISVGGFTPSEGNFSGTHVSGNVFDISAAGIGTHTVTYTKNQDGCELSDTKTITVNALPSVEADSKIEKCADAGLVTLNTAGVSPGSGIWSSGTAEVNNAINNSTGQINISAISPGNYTLTYTFTNAQGCTNSDTRDLEANGLPGTGGLSVTGDSRCGSGTVNLSASHSTTTHTFAWYTSSSGGSPLSTNATYSPSISATTDYWVAIISNQGCRSTARTKVTGTVFSVPTAPVGGNVERCGPGQVTMSASGGIAGAAYHWYNNATGGSPLHTGASFTTSVTSTRSYHVAAESPDGCISPSRTEVVVTINPIPGPPTTFDGSSCGPGVVNLSVGGAPAGGEYRWYPTESGGSSFNSSNTFDADITQTTSYWVSIISTESCEGSRMEIVATIFTSPGAPTGTPGERCGPGQVALSASGVGGTYDWFETEFSSTSLFTGPTYQPTINATTSFWVEVTDVNRCTSSRTEVIGTVHPMPPDPTVPSAGRCGPGQVALNASGSGAGATYDWFENATGGSSLFTGDIFEPTITLSKNFYVSGTSTEGCPSPGRTEVLVTISPIPSQPTLFNGENCGPGTISLFAGGAPEGGEYRWYPTETGGTSFNNSNSFDADITETTSYWVSVVTAQGCEGLRAEIVATINDLPPSPGGSDNERCGPGQVTLLATSGVGGTFNWYETQFSAVSLFSGASFLTPSLTEGTSFWVDFADGSGCVSARTEVLATIHPIPVDPTVPPVSRCGPGQVTIIASGSGSGATFEWYETSSGGSPIFIGETFEPSLTLSKSYFVTGKSPAGCVSQSRTEVIASINPVPSSPTVTDGNICGVGQVTLIAGGAPVGGDYNWYETAGSTEVISTGSEFTTPELVNTRGYFVSIVNEFNCEGSRSEVQAVVNSIPERPEGEDVQRCGEGEATLRVTTEVVNPVVNWYFSNAGGLPFANGLSLALSVDESVSYYASVVTEASCESAREEITVTVEEIFPVNVGDDISLCLNGGSFDLTQDLPFGVNPEDGIFTGSGIIGGTFLPSVAGVGTHGVTFILTSTIGCLVDGQRFITVVDVQSGGEKLTLSSEELNICYNAGTLDLSTLPNLPDGDWEGEGITLDIFDPLDVGEGEYNAIYTVEANGCLVQEDLLINVLVVPDDPVLNGESQTCKGKTIEFVASGGPAGTIYHWFKNDETESFIQGNKITLQLQETMALGVKAENAFGCFSGITETTVNVSEIEADFTASTEVIPFGGIVEFTTSFTDGESYLWDFGDGLTSTRENPTHYYYDEGSFTVTLTLTSPDGCIKTIVKQDMITVDPNSFSIVVGIDESIRTNEITVYPQPFDRWFTMDIYSEKITRATLLIYHLSGERVLEKTVALRSGENRITLNGYEFQMNPGVYVLKVYNGEIEKNIKIIKGK